MNIAGLSTEKKNRITEVLEATHYRQRGFSLKYDEEKNPVVIITYSSNPEYRFGISFTDGAFATSECPGIRSDQGETFQRSNFELCLTAIKDWSERIVERQSDSILDEYGGVADRLPRYE